jgi:hypothetical protein
VAAWEAEVRSLQAAKLATSGDGDDGILCVWRVARAISAVESGVPPWVKAQPFLLFFRGVPWRLRVVALAGRRVLSAAPWKVVFIDDSTVQLVFAASHSLASRHIFW